MVTLDQLRERKLGRWALAYLAGAWLVLQVIKLVSDSFGWSEVWVRGLIVALGVGFFAVLVVAWYHGERGAQRVSGAEFAILTVLFVLAGAAVALVGGGDGVPDEALAEGPSPLATPDASAEQASIAVLPFENLSSDPEQAYFSDGLTEELLNALAQVPGLRVSARTSSFAFKDTEATADSIGRALRVAHLVEGSVRKADDRVRIVAQLVDARSGVSQWSRSYDRELADVFAVQDEISRAIADELRVRVGNAPLATGQTVDPEAYALALRARQAIREGGVLPTHLGEAERLFEAALARDPSFAAALAGLASVHTLQANSGLVPREAGYAQARAEAARALDLDADDATAYATLARIEHFYELDYAAAAGHYRRALELNPSDARTHSLYASLLIWLGRRQDAFREGQLAVDLDPLSIPVRNNVGELYRLGGDYAAAVEQYRAALALNPDDTTILGNLTLTHALTGRPDEAVATGERALRLDPEDPFSRAALAYAYARGGKRAEAERLLRSVPDGAYFLRSMVAVGLGRNDDALGLLEQAADVQDDYLGNVGADPVFDPLHGAPRFARLLRRLGLPTPSGPAPR